MSLRPRLSFFWGVGMNFYMEIAKIARRASVMGRDGRGVLPQEP